MNTLEQLEAISQEMDKYDMNTAEERKKRNALVPKWRETYRDCDFGFIVGDLVKCPIIHKRGRIFTITKITKDNFFKLDDEVFVPGTTLKKYEKEPEQMSFLI